MAGKYFSLVLHSHIPYVLAHGSWPHGMDWLYEAAAETYMRRFCNDADGSNGAVCHVIDYDGNTDTMREVETGKLDVFKDVLATMLETAEYQAEKDGESGRIQRK